jgi:hypothetical protein
MKIGLLLHFVIASLISTISHSKSVCNVLLDGITVSYKLSDADAIVRSSFAYEVLKLSPQVQALANEVLNRAGSRLASEPKPDFVDFAITLSDQQLILEKYSLWLHKVEIAFQSKLGHTPEAGRDYSGHELSVLRAAIDDLPLDIIKRASATKKSTTGTPANELPDYRNAPHDREDPADTRPKPPKKLLSMSPDETRQGLDDLFDPENLDQKFGLGKRIREELDKQILAGDPIDAEDVLLLMTRQLSLTKNALDILEAVAPYPETLVIYKEYFERIFEIDPPSDVASHIIDGADVEAYNNQLDEWHGAMRSLWLSLK